MLKYVVTAYFVLTLYWYYNLKSAVFWNVKTLRTYFHMFYAKVYDFNISIASNSLIAVCQRRFVQFNIMSSYIKSEHTIVQISLTRKMDRKSSKSFLFCLFCNYTIITESVGNSCCNKTVAHLLLIIFFCREDYLLFSTMIIIIQR